MAEQESLWKAFTREEDFRFASACSIACGGRAKLAFAPSSVNELIALINKLQERGTAYAVLGCGTNVLPPDDEYDGAVILTKRLNEISFDNKVYAAAGVKANAFLNACQRAGKSGAEFLAGIPCSVGGAVYMNAGAHGSYLADILNEVLVYQGGQVECLPVRECDYAYKQSRFMKEPIIILGAYFNLSDSTPERVAENRKTHLSMRAHLPKGHSMGCVFKNPEGDSAGRLIDAAGLKGYRIGGAVVAYEHANFIINDRGATSQNICDLIAYIKQKVHEDSGALLQEEIRYLCHT